MFVADGFDRALHLQMETQHSDHRYQPAGRCRATSIAGLGRAWHSQPGFLQYGYAFQNLPVVLKELGIVDSGDVVVITAGIPINQMRPSNMIKINRIP